MLITAAQYKELFPSASLRYHEPLDILMREYKINNPLRISHFLAQVGHECARFTRFEENLNYSEDALNRVFGRYFRDVPADKYARKPEQIANRVYANRMKNGNEASGDGWKYRGRGCIQLTGKYNYEQFEKDHPFGVVDAPDWILENPHVTVLTGIWYWTKHDLNSYADLGDLETITRKINGGLHGLEDRKNLFKKAYAIFKGQEIRTLASNTTPTAGKGWDRLKEV